MINGIKENNNGSAMTVMHISDKKAGEWNQGNRSNTEITANTNNKTADITARNTDLVFAVNMTSGLLSIGELNKGK